MRGGKTWAGKDEIQRYLNWFVQFNFLILFCYTNWHLVSSSSYGTRGLFIPVLNLVWFRKRDQEKRKRMREKKKWVRCNETGRLKRRSVFTTDIR